MDQRHVETDKRSQNCSNTVKDERKVTKTPRYPQTSTDKTIKRLQWEWLFVNRPGDLGPEQNIPNRTLLIVKTVDVWEERCLWEYSLRPEVYRRDVSLGTNLNLLWVPINWQRLITLSEMITSSVTLSFNSFRSSFQTTDLTSEESFTQGSFNESYYVNNRGTQ